MALRLRRQRERRRDLRQLPAPQAACRRPAADQDGAPGRLHARGGPGLAVLGQLSLRTRLILGVIVLAAVGLVAADVATYSSLRSFLIDQTDSSLDAAHRAVEFQIGAQGPFPGRGGPGGDR